MLFFRKKTVAARDLRPGDVVRWHDGTPQTLEKKRYLDGSDGEEVIYCSRSRDGFESKSKICLELTFIGCVKRCYPSDKIAII